MTEAPKRRTAEKPERSIGRRIATGAAWFMGARWTVRLIGLVSTIVLARVLVPEDFGLVAIATSYIALLNAFTDLGTRSALIRHDLEDSRFIDTVFTAQALRGLTIGVVVFLSGFVLPGAIGDERLMPIIWWLSLEPVLSGLMSPAMVLFERELNFWRELAVQIGGKITGAITAISCALIFKSYWAMVGAILADAAVRVALSYLLARHRPRMTLTHWRQLLQFSGWLTGSSFLEAMAQRLDEMLIGVFLGVRTVGIYNVGKQLGGMPLGEFLPVVNRALFPGLMQFKDDPEKLKKNTLDSFEILMAISIPISIGFTLVADDFVRIFYGEKWIDAIPIVQFVSICMGIQSLGLGVATSLAMAKSHTKMLFFRSGVHLLIRVPVFILGVWLFGLTGALAGYFVGSVVLATANLSILHSLLHVGYATVLKRIWRAVTASVGMAVAVYGLSTQLTLWQPSFEIEIAIAVIFAKIATGAVTYCGARLLLWKVSGRPEILEEKFNSLVGSLLSRRVR